jgi:CYTH domain-containing protein
VAFLFVKRISGAPGSAFFWPNLGSECTHGLAGSETWDYKFGDNSEMPSESKYARIEWERRFLVRRFPIEARVTHTRRIVDRYIEDTRLRLRQMIDSDGTEVFKLTQKISEHATGARQGFITNMYLSREEFDVLTKLPARSLAKTRHSVRPFGIDVFEGTLDGLIVAEAEFNSDKEASSLVIPSFVQEEVTDDSRFTGGSLVAATRNDLRKWLADYRMTLE